MKYPVDLIKHSVVLTIVLTIKKIFSRFGKITVNQQTVFFQDNRVCRCFMSKRYSEFYSV